MKTLARPALRSAATSISTMAGVRIRALTERHPIKPTSPRCHSAWQLNLGRYSTYRRGKSVQTTGTTSSRFATRLAYGASQLPRVAWYLGHSVVMRQLSEAVRRRAGESTAGAPVPDRRRLYADMATLFLQDLANVEAAIYPLPADHYGSLLMLLHRSRM